MQLLYDVWKRSTINKTYRKYRIKNSSCFCICECRYIAMIVRVPEVCKRALSQSATAYRWNDVMIIISKWRFTEGWNKGKFVNLQLKLYIKGSPNNVILLVWIWQMALRILLWNYESIPHVTIVGVYRVVSVDVYVLLNLTFSLVILININ